MRGSLQLSLNAVVMFIVSIIVLGFGIYLIGVFLDMGTEIVQFDHCGPELERAMVQGDRFVICPSTIPSSRFSARTHYQIHYAFFNVADTSNSDFLVNTTSERYEIQPSFLRNVPRGEWRRGTFIIRLDPNYNPERDDRIRVHICPESGCPGGGSMYGDDTTPLISRQLVFNT